MRSYLDTKTEEQYDIVVLDYNDNEVSYASRPKVSKENVIEEINNRNAMSSYRINGYTARLVKCTVTRSYEIAD